MFAKILLSMPFAAMFSYITGLFSSLDGSALEQATIDFVVLGRIPLTQTFLEFEWYLFVAIGILWIPFLAQGIRYGHRIINQKVDYIASLEAIAL